MSVIGTEGLTMSNRGGSAQNVRVSTDSVTHIDIALERAVAKVEIGKRYGYPSRCAVQKLAFSRMYD